MSAPDPRADETPGPTPPGEATPLLDRDLSLLAFQRRVLDEALDETNPLLERVRLLGSIGSNVDEFFLVREAQPVRGATGDLPTFGTLDPSLPARLEGIRRELTGLMRDVRRCFHDNLVPALSAAGIHLVPYADLNEQERDQVAQFFHASIEPLLLPLAFDEVRPFTHIGDRGMTLAVRLCDRQDVERFAVVRVPDSVAPLVPFHWRRATVRNLLHLEHGFVWLDEVVAAGLPAVFPGMRIIGAHAFRVVRSGELQTPQAGAGRFPDVVEGGEHKPFGDIVALIVDDRTPQALTDLLVTKLRVPPAALHRTDALRDVSRLVDASPIARSELRFPAYAPRVPEALRAQTSVIRAVAARDVLLHHPFESFEPVIRFFEEAAHDPDVVSISMTMCRLDRHSRIVQALLEATENGKVVRVVVELGAQNDEENTVAAARALERAGAHVVYGAVGLEVHAKLALVVRREGDGIRRYVHISSGHYNADTARACTDAAILTSNAQIAADVTDLFNRLTGHGVPAGFRKLLVAPSLLRERFSRLIADEVACHQRDGNGRIILKMNALEDPEVIAELYRASQAGVRIDLIVRGICCLRPGGAGMSDTISVRSIVGQFLEHSRLWYFRNGGQERVYLGSADLMTRNLDRHVEVMVPVDDEGLLRRVRDEILGTYLADNVKAWLLRGDGRYVRASPNAADRLVSSQRDLLGPELTGQTTEALPGFDQRTVPVEETARPVPRAATVARSDPFVAPLAATMDGAAGDKQEEKQKKKREKARAAWISFAGRIIAQVLGAVATIVLGVYVVGMYSFGRDGGPSNATVVPAPPASPRPVRSAGGEARLAVLPLQNFSGDPQQDYFADGMTEALIADLGRVRGLHVISRTSSMHYKGQQKSVPEIAATLGVDLIVEGSIAKAGDRVRITAQLIDAVSDRHIWTRTYDHDIRDVIALKAEIAATIGDEVRSAVTTAQREGSAVRRVVDPAVYDAYLLGREAWNRRSPEGFREAIGNFDRAIAQDPGFAPAYAGLADAYQWLGTQPDVPDAPARAKAAAVRAVALDETLAEAHTSLGGILHRSDADVAGAEREFRRALELNPGHSMSHQLYAVLLAEERRDEDALRHAERSVALDPLSGRKYETLALVHTYARRYEAAAAAARRALELVPQLSQGRDLLARALRALGKPEAAIRLYPPDTTGESADSLATLGLAHLRAGNRAQATTILDELLARQPVPAGPLARWYEAIGDHQHALEMLERLAAEQPAAIQPLKGLPAFDTLRKDPRFIELVRHATARAAGRSGG